MSKGKTINPANVKPLTWTEEKQKQYAERVTVGATINPPNVKAEIANDLAVLRSLGLIRKVIRIGVTIKPEQRSHPKNTENPPGSILCVGCGFRYAGQDYCPNCGYALIVAITPKPYKKQQ